MAYTVAHIFINEYVVNYGWPEKILTDQAKDFKGKVFKELCDQALVKKLRMTPYHPQGNGQPERFNLTLLTMLGTLPLDSKKRWEDWVSNLTQAYNSSPSRVTGFSPYCLMFGRNLAYRRIGYSTLRIQRQVHQLPKNTMIMFSSWERGLNGHIKPHKCILKEMQPIGTNIMIGNSIVWK